jgi:penicillin-binding protein 1A
MRLVLVILSRILVFSVVLVFLGGMLGGMITAGAFLHYAPGLPETTDLEKVRLQVPLRILSADRKVIAEFGAQRRTPLEYKDIPRNLKNAFVAIEDSRFYEHPGVDVKGLIRAAVAVIKRGGRKAQGASTITMQLSRNLFLGSEKSYERKIKEIFVALKIEHDLKAKYGEAAKNKILELYLNKIFLGQRANGVQAAAHVYYGKNVKDLTLAQSAMIAGLPKAPSRYNPVANEARAKIRRDYILKRMYQQHMISEDEYKKSAGEPVTASRHSFKSEVEAPYVAEMVRRQLIEKFGNRIYEDGFTVYTTIHSKHQAAANKALRKTLLEYDRRHGYRKDEVRNVKLSENPTVAEKAKALDDEIPIGNLIPGIVTDVMEKSAKVYTIDGAEIIIDWDGLKWARPFIKDNLQGPAPKSAADVVKVGDIIRVESLPNRKWMLAQIPSVSGAFVSVNPKTGGITSLVGGFDYYDKSHNGKYNRATQAKRQPGSSFKPFIYSAALEKNFTPASIFNDGPIMLNSSQLANEWKPENADKKFLGNIRMREALFRSRNLVAVRILQEVGIQFAIDHAMKFGFEKKQLTRNLSLALGSPSITPLQLAEGYTVFANGGYKVSPYVIESVYREGDGEVMHKTRYVVCDNCELKPDSKKQAAPRVISEQNAYQITSMLKDVVKRGTAKRARVLKRSDIGGKTGTTNEQKDAWFSGYNSFLVATVWVGFDDHRRPLGRREYGGRAALPAWIRFMGTVLKGKKEYHPRLPKGMVTVRINPKDGLLATSGTKAELETFRTELVPKAKSHAGSDTGTTTGTTAGSTTGTTSNPEEIF